MRFFMSKLISLNAHEFHHVLEEQRGISLVFFTHTLCSSCRAWKMLLQNYMQDHSGVKVFEIDAETEMALTNEFEIFHLPAMFLYHNGQYHAPIECEASLKVLEQTINGLLLVPAGELP